MKKLLGVVVVGMLSLTVASPIFADADDAAWIKKCVSDNMKEGQTTKTVTDYCECMNNEMSSSETKSISEWEKTHKTEEEACAKKSGWAG